MNVEEDETGTSINILSDEMFEEIGLADSRESQNTQVHGALEFLKNDGIVFAPEGLA